MITYTRHDGLAITTVTTPLVDLYATVYAEPPYHEGPDQVDRFRSGLPEEARRPGFTLITATDEGTLVGAAYGWTMPAGSWWSRAERPPSPEVFNADKLAVMEWIVAPERRGQGIGRTLIRQLLEERPERYATLASDPRSAARAMYRRAGWKHVGKSKLAWGPAMDLLVTELPVPPARRR